MHGIGDWQAETKVLPDKLTVPQLVKNFPAFYGDKRFAAARHLSPSLVRSIQSTFSHPYLRSTLISSSHLCHVFQVIRIFHVSPPKFLMYFSFPQTAFKYWGELWIYQISSDKQPRKGGHPARDFGERLQILTWENRRVKKYFIQHTPPNLFTEFLL
jgi:hypothetical protein